MSSRISGGAGGLACSSLSSSSWLSECSVGGSRGADISAGTLKHAESLTR